MISTPRRWPAFVRRASATLSAGFQVVSLAAGDLTGDGRIDLVVGGFGDPSDQATDSNGLRNVVYIENEDDDGTEDQAVIDDDGESRQLTAGALAIDLSEDRHRVGEGADEEPDRQLAAPVMQNSTDNSW